MKLATPYDLEARAGQLLGTSEWLTVTQKMIDDFAELTGDHFWIHTDVERCKRERPDGKTIAHGYLTISLLPRLAKSIFVIETLKAGFNYGSNRVRFTEQVQVDRRIRLRQSLKDATRVEGNQNGAIRFTFDSVVEIEDVTRPAVVAETLSMLVSLEKRP